QARVSINGFAEYGQQFGLTVGLAAQFHRIHRPCLRMGLPVTLPSHTGVVRYSNLDHETVPDSAVVAQIRTAGCRKTPRTGLARYIHAPRAVYSDAIAHIIVLASYITAIDKPCT